MAVVKANAYGHGMQAVARRLSSWCDSFAVATVEEGITLRSVVDTHPIIVLSAFQDADDLRAIREHTLSPVIHNMHQLQLLIADTDTRSTPLAVWVKVNSGMNRAGLDQPDVEHAVTHIQSDDGLILAGIMSHLASADDTNDPFTDSQVAQFTLMTDGHSVPRSLANSAGVLAWPATHFDVVRPGLMLYGVSPLAGTRARALGLRPVMRFESNLIGIRRVEAGASIGYGQAHTTTHADTIGLVGCGYGDGYPRLCRDGTSVQIGMQLVPKVGRVSMDSFTVSLRDYPNARVGDRVVLWGDKVSVEDIAESAGTIAYETLCQIPERVSRRYHCH